MYNQHKHDEYCVYKRQAVKWARRAIENKKLGLPWNESAKIAHEYLSWALLIIS